MNKSIIRELTFKLLYSLEVQKDFQEENYQLFFDNNDVIENNAKEEIKNSITNIVKNNEEIESQISSYLKADWKIERISKVNISLMKLAIYEMMYKKIPYKIVINEIVELAKKYGEDTSASFINGVLATVVKENNL
jgi:N utilization substance protein B